MTTPIFPPDALSRLADEYNLSETARGHLAFINSSEPARLVGGSGNVIGKFQSGLMRRSLQFESDSAEFSYLWLTHYRWKTQYIVDQPCVMRIEYQTPKGGRHAFSYTPDFLTLAERPEFVECKTEQELLLLTNPENRKAQPWRYAKLADGTWISPPAAEAAGAMGFGFRVFSTAEVNATLLSNLQFLEDYYISGAMAQSSQTRADITATVNVSPGISVREIIELLGLDEDGVDTLYFLIAAREIYIDIEKDRIAPNYTARIFPSEQLARTATSNRLCITSTNFPTIVNVQVGSKLCVKGQDCVVLSVFEDSLELLNSQGSTVIPITDIEELIAAGSARPVVEPQPQTRQAGERSLADYSAEELTPAINRYRTIEPYLRAKTPAHRRDLPKKSRTQRRHLQKFKAAEAQSGYGLLGLVDLPLRGNTITPRLDPRVRAIVNATINEFYLTKEAPSIELTWGECMRRCTAHNPSLPGPSRNTVRNAIRSMDEAKAKEIREGPRNAYSISAPDWSDSWDGISIDGEHAWAAVHIDHTQIDLATPPTPDGLSLGRPWLTLMISTRHKRPIAMAISFEEPSYRSCMAVLRDCVARHHRLPAVIIVDRGPEFKSNYFDALLARFRIHKKLRPPMKPRFGAALERMNCTVTTSLIHNLPGNTKLTKRVRTLTKSHAPEGHAELDLAAIRDVVGEFLFEWLDSRPDPLTGISPRELFSRDLKLGGARNHRVIMPDREFRILTLPSTRRGFVRISRREGAKVHGIPYWCAEFRNHTLNGKSLPVRYEPDDLSTIFVQIDSVWVECRSRRFQSVFAGLTEREIQNATTELLAAASTLREKRRAISAESLALFFHRRNLSPKAIRLHAKAAAAKTSTDQPAFGNRDGTESAPNRCGSAESSSGPPSRNPQRSQRSRGIDQTNRKGRLTFPTVRKSKQYKVGFRKGT